MAVNEYIVVGASIIALAIGSAKAADLDRSNLVGYTTGPTVDDDFRLGGQLSFSFEDSGHFQDQHYSFNSGISNKFSNNIIIQANAAYSNYVDTNYPIIDLDFLFGYQFTEALSAAALVNYEDFDGDIYWAAGFDTKFSTYRFDVEWGGKVYLTENGDSYDGWLTTLIGTFHLSDSVDAIATASYVEDDGDIYKTLGGGLRWTHSSPGSSSVLDGIFVEGMGYIGNEKGVGDYSVGKITIGMEFGSGQHFKKKGWFEAIPSWY